MSERKQFLMNRIDKLDECIHKLESTANHFYKPEGKDLKGWNLLLNTRDKIVSIRDKDWIEINKLEP